MSYILHDPDEWEGYSSSTPCGHCQDDRSRCNGMCTGSASWGLRRRAPEEVAKIKEAKRRKHEADVLAEADAIRAARRLGWSV